MRTLLISDLHLGTRLRRDVLREPEALEALLTALDGIDRLVLLGDVVELAEGRARHAMEVAAPVLRAIGTAMGPDREIVVVPGNHDRALIRPWLRGPGAPSSVEAVVPLDASAPLARVVAWLKPARVAVRYPGVWIGDRVWATHGHYLDRHLVPVSAYGIWRGLLRRPARDTAEPAEYEVRHRPTVARLGGALTRWLPRPLAALVDDLAELARAATMPTIPRRLSGHRIAPVTARILGLQMQRASLPALARVAHRLRVDADWVIFGHVHRSGPLAGDDPRWWRGPGGTPRMLNTGAWVYEPLLVHRARPPHPYWPGGAVLVEDGAEPRAVGLLDHLPEL